MYNVRKIKENLYWVGANDRNLANFERIIPIPRGVSYNSYILLDEKNVLFDTMDASAGDLFFENIAHVLNGGNTVSDTTVSDHKLASTVVNMRW